MIASIFGSDFPFDYLHAEIVKYFKEREKEKLKQKQEWVEKIKDAGAIDALNKDKSVIHHIFAQGNAETRLEAMGYRVGYSLVEKISKEMPRLANELEIMKFLCKEFWINTFGKQVDNLKTNHQGIYVIQDNKFLTVAAFSEGTQYIEEAAIYLSFPAGLVRGALANLGILCIVIASTEKLPTVKFNVNLNKS